MKLELDIREWYEVHWTEAQEVWSVRDGAYTIEFNKSEVFVNKGAAEQFILSLKSKNTVRNITFSHCQEVE